MSRGPDWLDRSRVAMAVGVLVAFIGNIAVLMVWHVPAENRDFITYMLGELNGMASAAVAFYFGSSIGQGGGK